MRVSFALTLLGLATQAIAGHPPPPHGGPGGLGPVMPRPGPANPGGAPPPPPPAPPAPAKSSSTVVKSSTSSSSAKPTASCPTSQCLKGVPFPSLINVTLEDLQAGLAANLFTSVDLVNAYTARIGEVQGNLSIVTEINPDALAIAADLDAKRKAGIILGPLHGIPMVVKNNIATFDKMNNTAGSYALLGARVSREGAVASKLRKSGAIILGKANLSQWAYFRCYNCSNGWSAHGGQTKGAYYVDQDPSGSSSGSGVSTSIGAIWAALGTETDGSLIGPADVNNVCAIKPTVGLTSRDMVIPISEHQDTVGPLARTVKDAAYILSAIAGFDSRDNYTSANPDGNRTVNYAAACNSTSLSLKGKRFGVPWNVIETYGQPSDDPLVAPLLAAFNASIATIVGLGATIVPTNLTINDGVNEEIVLDADFPVNLDTYIKALTYNPQKIYNLENLRDFTEQDPRELWTPTSRDVAVFNESLDLGYNNTDYRFWQAYQADLQLGGPDGIIGALSRDKLDAVLLPSQYSYSFAAIVGTPIVSVPMGFYPQGTPETPNSFGDLIAFAPNLPFGLSFMGAKWSEYNLISYAYAFEQKTMVRNMQQPAIVPHTELKDVVSS